MGLLGPIRVYLASLWWVMVEFLWGFSMPGMDLEGFRLGTNGWCYLAVGDTIKIVSHIFHLSFYFCDFYLIVYIYNNVIKCSGRKYLGAFLPLNYLIQKYNYDNYKAYPQQPAHPPRCEFLFLCFLSTPLPFLCKLKQPANP